MFGQMGYVIHKYSLGMDYSRVLPVFPQNSVTFSKAFDSPVSDWHVLSATITECVSSFNKNPDVAYMAVRRLKIALECDNGNTVNRKRHLVKPVSMYGGLQRICECLLKEIFESGDLNAQVRAVSVAVYGSVPGKDRFAGRYVLPVSGFRLQVRLWIKSFARCGRGSAQVLFSLGESGN